MNHNIFMKRIEPIVVILNYPGFLFYFYFFVCLFAVFFHVWKPCFWIFIKNNFFVTQTLKCPTVRNHTYYQNPPNPLLERGSTSCYSCFVTLRLPSLKSETGWTEKLLLMTNLLNWQNKDNSIFFERKKQICPKFPDILKKKWFFEIFWNVLWYLDFFLPFFKPIFIYGIFLM